MPTHEAPERELKRLRAENERLRAENERLRHELAAGRANLHELWSALALIRDAIEELALVGAIGRAKRCWRPTGRSRITRPRI